MCQFYGEWIGYSVSNFDNAKIILHNHRFQLFFLFLAIKTIKVLTKKNKIFEVDKLKY